MTKDPYKYFRLEARELLNQFGTVALELEKGGDASAHVQRLLRLAHTLKGAARVVKQFKIADAAHAIEEILAPFRDAQNSVPRECVDSVLGYVDQIESLAATLAPTQEQSSSVSKAPEPEREIRSVRADIAEMDALLDGVAETHALLAAFRRAPEILDRAQRQTDLLIEQLGRHDAAGNVRQAAAERERAQSTALELRKNVGSVQGEIRAALDQIDRELDQLRDAAEQLRLVPAGSMFVSLERTVRDTAQELGKKAAFEGSGAEVRLDAHVLALVQSALVQIVRNAVAHGIEEANDRKSAGKPIAGLITLAVSHRGRQIAFTCRDDGRGIDLDAVQRVAKERGLIQREAKSYSAGELVQLLMRGGISTSARVTEIAGRGIGLDVVRSSLSQLGGEIAVHTDPGKGTRFDLVVPLSLASLEVLVVEAGSNAVAIPMDCIRTVETVSKERISWSADGASIIHEDRGVPFISLPQALYGTRPQTSRAWTTVIVEANGDLAAIGVDRARETTRVTVRPFPELAPVDAIVGGVSVNADGTPQLVLDAEGLAMSARRRGIVADLQPMADSLPILVVDDSLTTRMLERSILESEGYQVDLAASGEEGLECVQRRRYALVLCDVEMPGMDGFAFIERLRADPSTHDIPAIMVTSRAEPEDIARGHSMRIQGYVVKSEFDQTKLLATIRNLTAAG